MNRKTIAKKWKSFKSRKHNPKKIVKFNLRVALINELVSARKEKGISQKKLEELSGVRQPVIARIEKGITKPQIDTLIKLLSAMGKTLTVVPIKKI